MTAVTSRTRTATRRSAPVVSPRAVPPATQPGRRLTVARPPVATGRRRVAVVAALVVLLLAVLAVSASQALLVQSQDRLDDLQRQITVEQQVAERQRLELARLQAPTRIVGAATERLGMVAPSEIVYLRNEPSDDQVIAVEPSSDPGVGG